MKNFGTLGDRYEELYTYENENVINDEYIDRIFIDHKLNDLKIYYHEPEMILGGDYADGSQANEIFFSRGLFDVVACELQGQEYDFISKRKQFGLETFRCNDVEIISCMK